MAAVGVVKGIVGTVTATDPSGNVRILKAGDFVAQNEVIKCDNAANIHVDFFRGGFATIGSGDSIHLNANMLDQIAQAAQENVPQDQVSVENTTTAQDIDNMQQQIEEAIARGEDPTALMEATAAGPGGNSGGGSGQEGGSFVVVDQNAERGSLTFSATTSRYDYTNSYEYNERGDDNDNDIRRITDTPTSEEFSVNVPDVPFTPSPLSVTIDLTPIALNDVNKENIKSIDVSLTGTVGGDAKAGDTVTITLPNGDEITTTVNQDGKTFTAETTADTLVGGGHVDAKITISDEYGQTVSAVDSEKISIDYVPNVFVEITNIAKDAANLEGDISTAFTKKWAIDEKGLDSLETPKATKSIEVTDEAGNSYTLSAGQVEFNADFFHEGFAKNRTFANSDGSNAHYDFLKEGAVTLRTGEDFDGTLYYKNPGNAAQTPWDGIGVKSHGVDDLLTAKIQGDYDGGRKAEINYDWGSNTSEALVFDLGDKLAYGVGLTFANMFGGTNEGREMAALIYYRDDKVIGFKILSSDSANGQFEGDTFSEVMTEGFNKLVVTALNSNQTRANADNSDFVVSSIKFNGSVDSLETVHGRVWADSVDGYDAAYEAGAHASFAYEQGQIISTSLGNITLDIEKGSGSSNDNAMLTGILESGDKLFTAILDNDGTWTFSRTKDFTLDSGEPFTLDFMTKDSDGDAAYHSVLMPTNGADILIGTDGNNTLYGIDGDDAIFGGGGDDIIQAGGGDDIVFGDHVSYNGEDDGKALADLVEANNGDASSSESIKEFLTEHLDRVEEFTNVHEDASGTSDKIYGGDGDDLLFGQGGHDVLDAGKGNDILVGGSGDDLLIGNSGDNILIGGEGHDTFKFTIDSLQDKVSGDVIKDFNVGEDTLELSDLLTGVKDDNGNPLTADGGALSLKVEINDAGEKVITVGIDHGESTVGIDHTNVATVYVQNNGFDAIQDNATTQQILDVLNQLNQSNNNGSI